MLINVLIKTDSHYRVNRERIRNTISSLLAEKKVRGEVEVSVMVVGDRLMRKLNNEYRKLDKTTDVLSFPLSSEEGKISFVDAPDHILRLGDIVLSYPQAVDAAGEENMLVDDKIDELAEHGLLHLLGYHHD
mgnify:CR=1 FL=1